MSITNEELAVRFQNGEKELINELWNNTQKLFYLKSNNFYNRFTDKCIACGVELADIYQSCFLALHEAARAYKADSGYKFTTYITYSFKNAVNALLNGGQKRRISDPLNNRPISLDVPLTEDTETTKADMLPDETAAESFDNAEERIYTEELHNALEQAMQTACNEREADILRRLYWNGETLAEAAKFFGVAPNAIHQSRNHAFRDIKRNFVAKSILQPYKDFIESHAYHGTGLTSFRSSGTSSVERTVELWESELEKKVYELMNKGQINEARALIHTTVFNN